MELRAKVASASFIVVAAAGGNLHVAAVALGCVERCESAKVLGGSRQVVAGCCRLSY